MSCHVPGRSVFGEQMWKDGLDSGSGCAHGSEVGSAAHEQTYCFAVSEICMDF